MEVSADGLPRGLVLKAPCMYGRAQLEAILEVQEGIHFQGKIISLCGKRAGNIQLERIVKIYFSYIYV